MTWADGRLIRDFVFVTAKGTANPDAMSDARQPDLKASFVELSVLPTEPYEVEAELGIRDVVQIPRGTPYQLDTTSSFVRYAMVCSTPFLEAKIDHMTSVEREQSRIHNRAN